MPSNVTGLRYDHWILDVNIVCSNIYQVGLELFRPERDELELGNVLDEGFNADFLQDNIRRFSGNIGDFNKPRTYKDYEFRSFTLDIDSVSKSERPEWGEGKYQGNIIDED